MMTSSSVPPLELWGGAECSVTRVGDHYFDQLERTGYTDRPGDLERFATLGVRALRLPVLWERTARFLGKRLAVEDNEDQQSSAERLQEIAPSDIRHGRLPLSGQQR